MISKTFERKEPVAIHAYEVTPAVLREWADRLESKHASPGQIVRLPIAMDAEIFYNPRGGISYAAATATKFETPDV